ncbi:MAG TPA: hypothetical protein DCX03_04475 [Bacteroidales bacterium]|nr:hypothetical protein [Bacteroidales bacterium]
METIGTRETGVFSTRLNGIIGRYADIVKQHMPELAVNEWLFICDMLNGCDVAERQTMFLHVDIRESGELDGLGVKWEVDYNDLAKRVESMNIAEITAIHDVVYRFWQNAGFFGNKEQLLKCGARIKS